MFTVGRKSYGMRPPTRTGKRSRKRRSYKKRSYKKRSSKYTRSSYRSKRFPTTGPKSLYIRPAYKLPDRELIKMKYNGVLTRVISSAGRESNLECTDLYMQTLNTLWFGTIFGQTTSPVLPVTGFTAQNALYSNWQVRGVRCHIAGRIVNAAAFPTVPIRACLVPMSMDLAYPSGTAITPGSYAFNALCRLPGARIATFGPTNLYDNKGEGGVFNLTSFTSPSQVMSIPSYYSNSTSWGTDAATPTDLPSFVLAISHEQTLGAIFYVELTVTLTYSVMWFNRKMQGLALEAPLSASLPEDPTELEMDSLPEISRLSVSKVSTSTLPTSVPDSKEEKKISTGWFS